LTSFFAVSGLSPMRGSSALSAGTPMAIIVAPSARAAPVLRSAFAQIRVGYWRRRDQRRR
jgi:hypothetical protein